MLKPGEYYLRATESLEPPMNMPSGEEYFARQWLGTEYAPVFYPGVLQLSQAQTVSLRPGDDAQVDFSMRHSKTVEISGRVISPDGKLVNAMVELEDDPTVAYSFGDHSSNTDADGNFRLKGVPPGSYILRAYQEAADNVYRPAAKQKLEVGNDNIESITLTLTRGTDFRGRLIVDGPSPVRRERIFVSLHSIGTNDWVGAASVKQDGSFELKSVDDGNYTVIVDGLESNWYVKSTRLGSDDILLRGLQVEKGTGGTLEIVISSSSAQLDGAVMEGEKSVVGAHVRISPDPETPYNHNRRRGTTTDQTGRFLFVGLAPGRYGVIAKSAAPAGGEVEVARSDPQTVTLSERDHKTMQLTLVPHQNH